MRKTFAAFLLACSLHAGAQQVRPANSDRIHHEIEQLRRLANVLYFAAHPDDENTRLLAWLVNDQHIRTGYLSLTRGDGGQNILGSEQGDALGLIRTHELMEARKIDGAEQYFTRAVDFGFSKTHEETFKHWQQYLLTYDAVWVMRKFRPDVVICRFPPDTMAGHGQHAASAIIAAKAFKLAGDKMQYTEQLKTYPAWQPKRLLQNTYKFGNRNTITEDQFKLGVGQYEPGLGMGVGELAGQSRSVHKSQGAGTPSVPGVLTEYFKLIAGDSITNSLFDGIDITWNRVGRPDIGDDLALIEKQYDFRHPEASLPALLAVRKKIAEVKDDYWRKEKLEEIDRTIMDCTGLMAEVYTKQPQAVRGATLPFTLRVIVRAGKTKTTLTAIQWGNGDSVLSVTFPQDSLLTYEHNIAIPASEPLTQPYWITAGRTSEAMFSVPDSLLGFPEAPAHLNVALRINVDGTDMVVQVPLSYKKLDPVRGDVVEQLRIVPDVSVAFANPLIIANADGSVQADVRVHAFKDIQNGTLTVAGKTTAFSLAGVNLSAGTDTLIPVSISAAASAAQDAGDYYLSVELAAGGNVYNQAHHVIQYNHIPTLQYFTAPYSRVLRPTWKCLAKRIGYIEGAGDYTPHLLRLAGLEVDVLKEGDLAVAANLKKYDAIVTGIRAINVEKRMTYWMPVLLEYVKNGGTLVMQYNTTQDMSTTRLGPYPLTLASDLRVTEENAHITFADSNRILRYPNEITENDFTGWVQERGLYFASKWDSEYKTLFTMNDAGEQPLQGGTLYTKYGKGTYIYTSLSFFRQLPAGHKGAIRLLMNMLSANKPVTMKVKK